MGVIIDYNSAKKEIYKKRKALKQKETNYSPITAAIVAILVVGIIAFYTDNLRVDYSRFMPDDVYSTYKTYKDIY